MEDDGWCLLAGQMKAATTSLHAMLAQHPDVAASAPKETDWWTYRAIDRRAYRRRFSPYPGFIVDGSINATRAKTDVGCLSESFDTMGAPSHIVYVIRAEPERIASQAVHAFFHETFPRTRTAALDCVQEAIATSFVEARLDPLRRSCPNSRMLLIDFQDFARQPVATVLALAKAVGLGSFAAQPRFEHRKPDQRILPGPLRAAPGRDKIVRSIQRTFGASARRVAQFLPRGVPRRHPHIDAALAQNAPVIEDVQVRNRRFLRDLPSGLSWVQPHGARSPTLVNLAKF